MHRLVSDTKFQYQVCCVVIVHSILSEVRHTNASRPGKQNELVMHLFGHSLYTFFATALASDVPCIIRLCLLAVLFSSHNILPFNTSFCKHMASIELNTTAYIDALLLVQ